MPPKATNDRAQNPPSPTISGKWLIIGVFSIALLGAVTSWWFRYSTTHRAAQFWGPQVAQLIRDAPEVTFLDKEKSAENMRARGLLQPDGISGDASTEVKFNVSDARGLTHLRNALLEDRSFDWDATPIAADLISDLHWLLRFDDLQNNQVESIWFSNECRYCGISNQQGELRFVSCEPIAAGLREMFAEFSAMPMEVVPAKESQSPAADASSANLQR